MGKTTRKRYGAEYKAKVALEAIRGELTLSQLGAKYGVHQTDALLNYVRHPYVAAPAVLDESAGDQFRSILDILRHHTGTDFQPYKKGTLGRRILRRMGLRHLTSAADYVDLLRRDAEEIQGLFQDLLIGVTSFFRDTAAWEVLDREVIGPLVRDRSPDETIRVWVAGCATGEEAYSVAMLLHEQMEEQQKSLNVQIFASDLDERAIKTARAGLYPESVAGDVGPARLKRFFTPENGQFRVAKRVRESVVCAPQNLLSDPPFSKLDLVTCRNVLMYFEAEVQQRLVELFHFALREKGCLFLGKSEAIGRSGKLFEPVSREWCIFRRLEVAQPPRGLFPVMGAGERPTGEAPAPVVPPARQRNRIETVRRLLLERYAPASVVVNRRQEVQFFQGPLKDYFQFPDGEPTSNIMEMALDGLRPKLRSALHEAMAESKPVSATAHRVARNGGFVTVRIDIEPIPAQRGQEELFLVAFTDQETEVRPAEPVAAPPVTLAQQRSEQEETVRQLEDELRATRTDLQLTIEELETANEEMKASNEEVMSMNEELQSTNEELESSREELQSLNEELTTVNRQLEEKLGELESTNNDLVNLLSSTHIATLFLGLDRRIRRFTPSCTEFLNLIDTDIGRPIGDLAPRIADHNLESDLDRVIDKLTPVEAEIRNDPGQWFLRRVLPYRTAENRIEGLVLTYTDITGLKMAAQAVESRERQQAAVVALGRTALAGSELQVLFDQAAKAVAEQLDCEFSEVLALQPGSGGLLLQAGIGWKQERVGQATPGGEVRSLGGYILQTGGPVILEDIAREKRFRLSELHRDYGIVSGAGVIVGPEDKRWGALCVLSTRRRQFTVDDVTFLQAVAIVLTGAIERAQAEENQKLLTRELDHRAKNLLAVVNTVAERAGSSAPTVDEFMKVFQSRIESLARIHSQLSRGKWHGVDLSELVREELEPFAKAASTLIDGPAVVLPPDIAQAVSLTLHELATNAAKYGALSQAHGQVSVKWTRDAVGNPEGRLVMDWRESGGPKVTSPTGNGYGSSLIRELIPYEVPGSSVELDLAPGGVTCRIVMPLASIAPPPADASG
jgi:two-component system CheB/CheR fusion protein